MTASSFFKVLRMVMEAIFAFIFGLCFGSLNTLLAYRLPRGLPIGMVHSQCPACHTALTAQDLVPVFSWLASQGTCRHCGVRVHWRYPAIELATAGVFLLVFLLHGFTLHGILIALLGAQIVALCLIDFEHRIIPDMLQWSMGVTGIAYSLSGHLHIADALVGALVGAGGGLALQQGYRMLKKRDGLGMGDVKFMGVAGLWLGVLPLVPFFFYAGILGVISALCWRMLRAGDPYFPFGPALAFSLFLLVVYPPSEGWFLQLSRAMIATIFGV
jgi:leader peptidase (prepilin peptidase)/N-methyltransferase